MFFLRRKSYFVKLFLISFFIIIGVFISPAEALTQGGCLIGVVKDLTTEIPIKDASISISDEKSTHVVSTDIEGKFILGDLSPGDYKITVDIDGYDSVVSSNVNIDSGVITINDFSLTRTRGVLTGVVRNEETNEPIEGVRISISNDKNNFSEITDSLGIYTIDNVALGTYGITAYLENYNIEGPSSLSIISESTTKDFNLKKMKGEVFGKVISEETKEGMPGVVIMIRNGEKNYKTVTNSNGDFAIKDVNSGYYDLIADNGDEEKSFTILIKGGSKINQDIIF